LGVIKENRMSKFNGGKAYHGSEAVTGGRLRGATDTDYFYFFCPVCPGEEILRVLDFEVRHEQADTPYNATLTPKSSKGFVVALKLHCQRCGLTDFTKISNLGWQGGQHADTLAKKSDMPSAPRK
jgi:hypothetical protein